MNARRLISPLIKAAVSACAPQYAEAWQARREDRHSQKVLKKSGVDSITNVFAGLHGWKVRRGPFQGLELNSTSVGSALLPKLIGCYEVEIQPHIEHFTKTPYDMIIDVGSAEGYYAVGLARVSAGSCPVYAFDINPRAGVECLKLAKKNGVADRVVTRDCCDASRLAEMAACRALILCDCEGYEAELFRADTVMALRRCDLIIELHEDRRPGITRKLVNLLSNSHAIEIVPTAVRNPGDYPELNSLKIQERELAVSEFRGHPQNWLVGRPKNTICEAMSGRTT